MTPLELLQKGVEDGFHLGAQLCVLHNDTVIDFACGEARPGVPMTTDSIVQWYSAGKPLTAVLLAKFVDRGAVQFDQPVAGIIPEFAQNGKAAVTFRHLLTHTADLRSADMISPETVWPEMIRSICEAPLGDKTAAYSIAASWYILAEAIQRLAKKPFDEYVKSGLLDPLGMTDTWLRLPFAKYRDYGGRLAFMYKTDGGAKEQLPLQDAEGMAICRPGASARGPVRELAAFYRTLLNQWPSRTTAEMTSRQRVGLFDCTFLHTLDFGLGFIINSNRYGPRTVPYGYGLHASDKTFGHSGAQTSCAFADPAHNLVVAWVANGQPGERQHQLRQRALNTAIYEFLGLDKPAH